MERVKCLNCDKLENQLVLTKSLLEWIELILNNVEVSDFALSFPIVRRVYELKKEQKANDTKTSLG